MIANRQQAGYSCAMNEQEVVVVTGGARRIGAALVTALARSGYRVVIHCNASIEDANCLKETLCNEGCSVAVVQGDLAKTKELEQLFECFVACFGSVDHLVNNASLFSALKAEDTSLEQWESLFAVHSTAPFFLSTYLSKHLKQRGATGSVINILDTKLSSPTASRPAYYCSKGALLEQTKALAVALAPSVRVNAISPGPVLSNGDAAYFEKMQQTLPLKRIGSTTDVCRAALYLLGAAFMTGMNLNLDGGQHLL